MYDVKFFYDANEGFFNALYHFASDKTDLFDSFGMNLPSSVLSSNKNHYADRSTINWVPENYDTKHGSIAHFCVRKWGRNAFVYDWRKLLKALDQVTFIRTLPAIPWAKDVNRDHFYEINKKKLKKWFHQNHNRFLVKRTSRFVERMNQDFEYQVHFLDQIN